MRILGKAAQFELRILDIESKDGCECWLHLGDTGHVTDVLGACFLLCKTGMGP